jgi:hypothetical protein
VFEARRLERRRRGRDRRQERRALTRAAIAAAVSAVALVAVPAAPAELSRSTVAYWRGIARCETGAHWRGLGPVYQGGLGIYWATWDWWARELGLERRYPDAGDAPALVQIRVADYGYRVHGGYWGCQG